MELLIFILVVSGLLIWLTTKNKSRKNKKKSQPKVTIQVGFQGGDAFHNPDTGDVISKEEGGWLINPKSTFPLTIYGINRQSAVELKTLLEQAYTSSVYDISRKISQIIARTNLRCKEIDDYIRKFKPLYFRKIEQLKQESAEWPVLSDKDREDVLVSFRKIAVDSLDVRPYCNLEYLFEFEPQDFTIDDSLIERYGYDLMQFYVSYADRLDKVFIVPADNYRRQYFEKLAEKKLAIQGTDIPLSYVLNTLTIKEMNEIASDLSIKPFTRKSKAIEYLLNLPDLSERLRKKIAFRELFMLVPLPEEFSNINLIDISKSWKYVNEIAFLLAMTYVNGGYALNDLINKKQYTEYIKGWEIQTVGEDACPYCKRLAMKEYVGKNYPKVPLHVGCRCTVSSK